MEDLGAPSQGNPDGPFSRDGDLAAAVEKYAIGSGNPDGILAGNMDLAGVEDARRVLGRDPDTAVVQDTNFAMVFCACPCPYSNPEGAGTVDRDQSGGGVLE